MKIKFKIEEKATRVKTYKDLLHILFDNEENRNFFLKRCGNNTEFKKYFEEYKRMIREINEN